MDFQKLADELEALTKKHGAEKELLKKARLAEDCIRFKQTLKGRVASSINVHYAELAEKMRAKSLDKKDGEKKSKSAPDLGPEQIKDLNTKIHKVCEAKMNALKGPCSARVKVAVEAALRGYHV